LAEKYGDKHPVMICENNKLKQLQIELDSAAPFVINRVTSKKNKDKREYQLLEEQFRQQVSDIIELSRIAVEYNSLLRDLHVSLNLYNTINNRLHEQIAQLNLLKPNMTGIDRALPSDRCLWPNFMVGGLGFLFLGITLGVFFFVVAEIFDDGIMNRGDLDNLFGPNALGYVKSTNGYTIESGMIGMCTKINSELKNHNLNNINVVSLVAVDMLPFIIDDFISLETSILVITDRLIIFPNKCITYKEAEVKIGSIASINGRSAIFSDFIAPDLHISWIFALILCRVFSRSSSSLLCTSVLKVTMNMT
jgi:hypothetical protein